jgi:hypothetical protein
VKLADPDWFMGEKRLELHSRSGVRWSLANAELVAFDRRVVVAKLALEPELWSLAILDRATGRELHATEPRRARVDAGWGHAGIGDDHVVANDKHEERNRSVLRLIAMDGTERWHVDLGENVWAADLKIADGRLFALSATGWLYRFDS